MKHPNHRRQGRWLAGGLTLALAVSMTACDTEELLEVEDPETVNPITLEDPAMLPVVVAGAKGDFTGAFSGGESYLTVSALLSDELFSSGSFTTRTRTDRRDQFNIADGNTSDGTYNSLQFARRSLDDAAAAVAEFEGTDHPDYSELKALQGYTYILLGEGFCSSIPISAFEDGEFIYGSGQSSASLFQEAITLFDEALATGGEEVAAVGKGRALLDLGEYDQAAAAVSTVPTDYLYLVHHSVSGISNTIYSFQGNGRYSVSDREGINGLPYRIPEDPRNPWVEDPGGGFTETIPLYLALKYSDFDDPVVLASGIEARLIEAEAALQNDQPGEMISILNDLRADAESLINAMFGTIEVEDVDLEPLTDPGDDASRRDLLFEERGLWLYLTGHRLGDSRRLVYQYGLPQDEVYPTGEYHKTGTYGNDVVLPVDFDEANNPEYDLGTCDVTSAAIN